MQNLGELPEQQQGNMAMLAEVRADLATTAAALDRAYQQRTYLESMLSQYRKLPAEAVATSGAVTTSLVLTPEANLAQLRRQKADLLAS
jgi:Tfp pilus assembly protein PilE